MISTVIIAASAVTTEKVKPLNITASLIAPSAVIAEKIAANAITAGKIPSAVISTTMLAASAVTTAKIAASAVTTEKIKASNVTTTSLNTSAVTTAKIAASAVTAAKLRASSLDNIVKHGYVSGTLSASGMASASGFGFTPEGAIAIPFTDSMFTMRTVNKPTTSKVTFQFAKRAGAASITISSYTCTFYYECRRA